MGRRGRLLSEDRPATLRRTDEFLHGRPDRGEQQEGRFAAENRILTQRSAAALSIKRPKILTGLW